MSNEFDQVVRVLDALNCGALVIDRAGRVAHVNGRVLRMTGLPRDRWHGASLLDLYAGTEAEELVRRALADFDRPREVESFLPAAADVAEAGRVPVMFSSALLGTEPPLNDFRVVTVIDVSRLKQAESDARSQYRYIAEISNTVIEQAIELKRHSAALEEKVRQRTRELHDAHLDAIYMLAVASEAKDEDTGSHVKRIQRSAEALARRVGLPPAEAEAIGYAAILHDVGKFHVPDAVLKKPGPLTDDERDLMRQHTVQGERILASPNRFFDRARRVARSHHENWDGSGYPDGNAGANIPLEARIVHVADVYDALISPRVYKRAWAPDAAAAAIADGAGRLFDRDLARAFVSLVEEGALRTTGGVTPDRLPGAEVAVAAGASPPPFARSAPRTA